MYAKLPEFDCDIVTTHSIVKEELKLANKVNEKLRHELDEMNVKAAKNKEKYEHLKRRHTAFRDDVDKWSAKAQKKVCVLCNLARPLQPVPVIQLETYLLLQAAVWRRCLWFQTKCYIPLKAAVLLLQLVPWLSP